MKSLPVVLDVLLIIVLGLMIWQNHQLTTRHADIFSAYAEELNRLLNKQSGCETQLRACYMDLDSLKIYQGADGK